MRPSTSCSGCERVSAHVDELARIVDGTQVGPAGIVLGGRAFAPEGPSVVEQLRDLLYRYCYCTPFTGTLVEHEPSPGADLSDDLSRANSGRTRWQDGWRVLELLPAGGVAAERGGAVRSFWPGAFATAGSPPMPDATISVLAPSESRTEQPGFYYAFGETLPDENDELGLVRLYWNVAPEKAAELVNRVTAVLNGYQIPFRLKCLSNGSWFGARADPAVLFLARRHYRAAAIPLADVHRALQPAVRGRVPLFTKRLAVGVGLAEDPGDGQSFGLDRCRRIAAAIVAAHYARATGPERLLAVTEYLHEHGLDVERPYLRPGSADGYPCWEDRDGGE